jgi:hypothetical protein
MKNFIVIFISVVLTYLVLNEYKIAKFRAEVLEQRNNILLDQMNDLSEQLASARAAKTYEQGIADGIQNSKDQSYMMGYHAAIGKQP